MDILIADSHVVCREALENYIRYADDEITVRGASDYGGLMQALTEQKADFILLDPNLPGLPMMDDFTNVDLSNADARVGILVRDKESLASMGDADAHGVFAKSLPAKTIMQGIRTVMDGRHFMPGDHDALTYDEGAPDFGMRKKPDHFHLTQREKEVLGFLVQGATNKDVARALDLQVVTVKLHVRGICRKMEAKNRTQAALFAKEYGWDL